MGNILKPHTFQGNTVIASSEVNDNFDTIYSEFNGGISADNLADNAVTTAKIADDAVTADKIADATITQDKLAADLQNGWSSGILPAPNTVTYNGNRSYDLVFNSTDLTDTVTPGMRLRSTRTVVAPTQCTDLESGSSQYWSKSSPTGMTTFTDDWTVSAWIKLESYTGSYQTLVSKRSSVSGWGMGVNTTGQLDIYAFNTSGSNVRRYTSYQAIPLGKWVHVAATLDLSGSAGTMYFDGVLVSGTIANTGSAVASITHAGDFQIGAGNATEFLDGKIAQVGLFDAILNAATIRSYASQTLSGSETSCIGAWAFNGTGNDSDTNANNLSAQGSAVATSTDSPFSLRADLASGYTAGTTDFAIIQKASFSTNTTLTVQVPEGCTIPTTGGVSAAAYSVQKAPYGFPCDASKWRISAILQNTYATTSNATFGAFISGSWKLNVPVGSWDVGYQAQIYSTTTTPVYWNLSPVALTGMASGAGSLTSRYVFISISPTGTSSHNAHIRSPQSVTTQIDWVMYTIGSTTGSGLDSGSAGIAEIFAENMYL